MGKMQSGEDLRASLSELHSRSSKSRLCGGRNLLEDQSFVHFSYPKFYESVPIFFIEIIFIQAGYDAFGSILFESIQSCQRSITHKLFHTDSLRPCS